MSVVPINDQLEIRQIRIPNRDQLETIEWELQECDRITQECEIEDPFLVEEGEIMWLAVRRNPPQEAVGYAILEGATDETPKKGFLGLTCVCVSPGQQGKGIGTILIGKAQRYADIYRASIWTSVRPKPIKQLSFLSKTGFETAAIALEDNNFWVFAIWGDDFESIRDKFVEYSKENNIC